MKKSQVLLGLSLLATAALSPASWAGGKLYLRSGVIDSKAMSSSFSTSAVQRGEFEFLVQFKLAPTESDKAALRALGIQIYKYVPDDAYIARGTLNMMVQARRLAQVHAAVPYTASMKMSPEFGAFSVFSANKIENVLIKTMKDSDTSGLLKRLAALSEDIHVVQADGTAIIANVPQTQMMEVAALDGIEFMQPYVRFNLWDGFDSIGDGVAAMNAGPGDYSDLTGVEDGTKAMNFSVAYENGLTGTGQIVAMADTGLDTGNLATIHPDFQGSIVSGYAFGMFARSWEDPMGHGTHVAGSILGRGAASKGVVHGGAINAGMVAQGMWSPTLENLTVPPQLKTLFEAAYKDGARIHSNSWGAARNFGAYDSYAAQVDEFVWEHPDFLPTFAAGNSGVDKNKDGRIDEGSMSSPGTAKNCLTVGASENVTDHGGIQAPIKKLRSAADAWPAEPISSDFLSNNINGMAMFSSRGPTLDGRTKPDVVAPGTNILSAMSQVAGASDLWGRYNEHYAYSGGTSMATPLAAGAAAIAREKLQKMGEQNPSAALVKGLLMHTAVDMFPGQFGAVGATMGQELLTPRPNSDEGYGRVDVARIVQVPLRLSDEKTGIAQGETLSYEVNLSEARAKFWVTLVYSDAPAAASAAKTLVNDLNLFVTGPDGQERGLKDMVNNHEMIEIPNAAAGTYKITVRGERVPQGKNGKQPYALLISSTQN